MSNKLLIATCQFPVSDNIRKNSSYIKKLIKKAASNSADLVHFSETSLSGYAGVDFDSFDKFNWNLLQEETDNIVHLAKEKNIWIALGSTYMQSAKAIPTNCVYIISNQGQIVNRYDKRMLTKNDIKFYTKGVDDDISPVNIYGVEIGILICYDSSFQEMFESYKKTNVKVILLSLYNAKNKGRSFLNEITPSIIRTRAVDNDMWIVANNSSAFYTNYPTCIASPEGKIIKKLPKHKSGILYHEFPDENYKKWRIKWE